MKATSTKKNNSQLKILTIVGARPQFVKAFPVANLTNSSDEIDEVLVHTGQHYDANMSEAFFRELGLPQPKYNLGVGSGSHAVQSGKMLVALDEVLSQEIPDIVLVYGDTNSTLAGALAASKSNIPIAHVEAGLRSFNRRMPEEINRTLTDHASDWLFCPTAKAGQNLAKEGIKKGVQIVGDVMYDCHLMFTKIADEKSSILRDLGLQTAGATAGFYLATVHRPENTNFPERMTSILAALEDLNLPVIFPVHPRTRPSIDDGKSYRKIRLIDPVTYLDMMQLQKSAQAVLTDSGGMQKEALFNRVPCITLRDETEWIESVELGWNVIAGADRERIVAEVEALPKRTPTYPGDIYGDGRAAEKIVATLLKR